MSLAKYMQLYREYGFFNGSTIRVRIPDTSFYGSDLILSKDGNVLRTRTIDDDVVDFFTDESGTLILSADNGTSTLSGEVKISAYGTYNITLEGVSVDKSREVYAEKDVTLDDDKTTDTVAIGYTGDISKISAVSSNTSVCTVSVSGNKVTVKDAGKDFNGKATITATVEASQNYDAGEVNFYVNKLNGSLGTWADASDDVISSMIAQADAGEINLADYWNIGDIRRVHLNEIPAGTETAMQVEQDIDLVILHNPLGLTHYNLTTPTSGNRYQPHFIIGVKECLETLTGAGWINKSLTATDSSYTTTVTVPVMVSDQDNKSEIINVLNDGFINALPNGIKANLKSISRRYATISNSQSNTGQGYVNTGTVGTVSQKICLPNLKELGLVSSINSGIPSGTGVYRSSGSWDTYMYERKTLGTEWNNQINSCGVALDYFVQNGRIKTKGLSGNEIDYYTEDCELAAYNSSNTYKWTGAFATYITETGALATNNLDDSGTKTRLRGISPIMFI